MKCLLLLCIFGLAAARNLNDERESRLIGIESDITKTHQVAIVYKDNKDVIKVCTGAVIHPTWIITSAGCAMKSNSFRVQVGKVTVPLAWTGFVVKERIIHGSYNPKTMIDDIALLKLYDQDRIDTDILQIPDAKNKFLDMVGLVSGYGADKVGGIVGTLRETYAGILTNTFCKKVGDTLAANQFCTYPSVTCEGDQGSPFVIDSQLVGILSMRDGYATTCGSQAASTYNYVGAYRTWIIKTTGHNFSQ